jgi:hypothetical protein
MNKYLVRTGQEYYYGTAFPLYTKVAAKCFAIDANGYLRFYNPEDTLNAVFPPGVWLEVTKEEEMTND